MPDNPEIDDDSPEVPVDGDEAAADEEFEEDLATVYEARTERLRAYTLFLRATVPRVGITHGPESGREVTLIDDIESARNLAVMAVYQDIRRIAGDGRPNFDAENC